MHYTQLTTKDQVAGTMNGIKEIETKHLALSLQVKMNQVLKKHYLALKIPNKGGAESARQAIAHDQSTMSEYELGLPALYAHLEELQEIDAAEDAAKEAAKAAADAEQEATDSDVDDATATTETPAEPTPIESKSRKNGTVKETRDLVSV